MLNMFRTRRVAVAVIVGLVSEWVYVAAVAVILAVGK